MRWMHSVNLVNTYVGVEEISRKSNEVITRGFANVEIYL